jgi:hypothetical protein
MPSLVRGFNIPKLNLKESYLKSYFSNMVLLKYSGAVAVIRADVEDRANTNRLSSSSLLPSQ